MDKIRKIVTKIDNNLKFSNQIQLFNLKKNKIIKKKTLIYLS